MIEFSYRGISGTIEFSIDDMVFYGKLILTRGLVMYEGKTISELEVNFQEAVDDYLNNL